MSFTINNKLSFIDSFQFLRFSLDSLVQNLSKNAFKYLSQEFNDNIIDLVKQKGFYPYECASDFEKFKEELPGKEKLYSSLTDRKINDKEYEHVFIVWNKFKKKTMKDNHDFYLKRDVFLLANVFGKFGNNRLKNYVLCSSYYFSPPYLSLDAMLKIKKN